MARMGTAPGSSQHPAMPDPTKVVNSSLRVLRQHGLTDGQALSLIDVIAGHVGNLILSTTFGDVSWLTAIQLIARRRAEALTPSITDRTEIKDADG